MIRTIAKSVLVSAALLAAAGASAQPTDGAYVATPVAAPAMREMAACQLVARDAGLLSGFTANGKAFDAAQLDACNAKAKVAKTQVAKTDAAPATAN